MSIAGFPKRVRLLRSQDFRRVYDQGARHASPLFAAFCVREREPGGPRIGFTVPRALGKAVVRNRVKRQLRHLAAAALPTTPFPVDLVVRALPAVGAGDLAEDFNSALTTCLNRLAA